MRHSILVFIAAALTAAVAAAQQQPASPAPSPAQSAPAASAPQAQAIEGGAPTWIKEETPQQRRERLGMKEDPGPNPDPKVIYTRFGRRYHIEKFERRFTSPEGQPEGYLRPFAFVNVSAEIYQQNAQYVWFWMPEPIPESELPPAPKPYTPEQIEFLKKFREEFAPLSVPDAAIEVSFVEASEGLPTGGSWRNSLAVADMNEDGFADVIAPPQRGAVMGLPTIFLGDGKGHWREWSTKWPAALDYGGVAIADFNRDGHKDVVFAVHLQGLHVLLGDGKGNFTESSKGLATGDFPTRAVAVADLDADGWPDLIAINEGPTSGGSSAGSKVRGFLNRRKGTEWSAVDAADPSILAGSDSLAVGNFNRDRIPDFVTGSIVFQNTNVVFLSNGATKWTALKPMEGRVIPFFSMYYGVTAGRFSSSKVDDAILSYNHFWPWDIAAMAGVPDPEGRVVTGIDRISFAGKEPQRYPIVRWRGERAISGIASADFNGDGKQDIIYAAWEPVREFVLLLGDARGGFRRARLAGIKAEPQANYSLTVADVNGDGRPDVIISYESDKRTKLGEQNGSIHVFLNLGAKAVSAAAAKP